MDQPDSPNLEPQPEVIGPFGKLPRVARDLRETKSYEISPLEEMRFEVESTNQVHVWMSKGQAEIFGSELTTDRIYTFLKGSKLSIWSWTGCQIQIEGKPDAQYKTKENRVMTMYFNFHNCLEQHRVLAVQKDVVGPRVLVVGAPSTGRSTVCRILLNYAARMRSEDRRNPLFVDLDFVQPDLSVVGTIACCQFDRPADPMYDFLYHRKYVLPYGYSSPEDNVDLLHAQIKRLGKIIDIKFEKDKRAKHSGMIINAFGWQKPHGFGHIVLIAKAFKVNFILVVDSERIQNELLENAELKELSNDLQIVLMPKSRGVVDRNLEEKKLQRESRLRCNIYGHPLKSPKQEPYVHEMDFSDITLCNLGNPHLNVNLLPSTADVSKQKAAAYVISPTKYFINHVVYVTNVDTPDKVNTEGSVIGYLLIKDVDTQAKKITFISNFLEIPKKILLTSSVQLRDS